MLVLQRAFLQKLLACALCLVAGGCAPGPAVQISVAKLGSVKAMASFRGCLLWWEMHMP